MLKSLFNKVIKDKGLEDVADIDTDAAIPEGWEPDVEDPETDFSGARDKNWGAND